TRLDTWRRRRHFRCPVNWLIWKPRKRPPLPPPPVTRRSCRVREPRSNHEKHERHEKRERPISLLLFGRVGARGRSVATSEKGRQGADRSRLRQRPRPGLLPQRQLGGMQQRAVPLPTGRQVARGVHRSEELPLS